MKKIIYIAPHLSTGGLPQYLYRKVVDTREILEVYCIEYENITGGRFIVQREKLEKLLGERFFSIGDDKMEIMRIIDRISPDFVHLEEIPEFFMDESLSNAIYSPNRKYKIFETSHDSSFNPERDKVYLPDAFFFVSQWQINQYKNIDVPKYLAEYPIEFKERSDRTEGLRKLGLDPEKKHVLNVGLFTPRKNQAEIFEVATRFDDSVQFHFLGNQADNFRNYWEPLLNNKPSNCVVWGERGDTDNFYSCMDAFYFASLGQNGDKETMPLVLKEALGWKIPILLHNLDVYLGYFDKFESVRYLSDSTNDNSEILASVIGIEANMEKEDSSFETWYDAAQGTFNIRCLDNEEIRGREMNVYLTDSLNNLTNYSFKVVYLPGTATWFKSNGLPSHFNGFRISIHDAENGKSLHSRVVHDFARNSPICPMVKGKCVDIKHSKEDHSSWFTFYEVFIREDYGNIKEGDVVLDIGSNLGFVSLYAVEKGASKVYSLEPDPEIFGYLKENTKGFQEIIPIQYAISDKPGEVRFFQGNASSIGTTCIDSENIDRQTAESKSTIVKSIDPDSLISEFGIEQVDYLKIDCEGAEFDFFRNIDEGFLTDKVKYITGEVHRFAGSQSDYESTIKNKLVRCGFQVTENDSLDTNTELIFKAVKRPKIKVVHLLNTPDEKRERDSIESLRSLREYGIGYEQVITPLYADTPPAENCNRPDAVSDKPGDYLLGPGHYGCYLAHRKGIVEGLEGEFDAILLNECDSILQFSAKETAEKIFEAYEMARKYNLAYVSFGKRIPGHQHENVEKDFYTTDKLSEAHCILITKDMHGYFKSKFENTPWDVSDLWYNVFINDFRKGIFSRPYSLQHPGVSNIDLKFKDGFELHEENSMMSNFDNSDITVIVQTCDNYEFLWKGWYLSFKRNWDWSLGWPVCFCTESKSPSFKDSRIGILNTGASEGPSAFSNRLTEILSRVKTKYVLYIQEDMWLKSKVDGRALKESLYLMKHLGWNSVKVHEKIWFNYKLEKTGFFAGGKRVLKYDGESEYLITHNAALWNREFLLDCMAPNENPWENEMNGTLRARGKYGDPNIYHVNLDWYYPIGIQQGGKFLPMGEEIEKQLIYTEQDRVKYDMY